MTKIEEYSKKNKVNNTVFARNPVTHGTKYLLLYQLPPGRILPPLKKSYWKDYLDPPTPGVFARLFKNHT
jgi:hypothetical protein